MVKILVTGANGYIGKAVALALRRNGHSVFGLVRSDAHAEDLLRGEVVPVIGDVNDVKSFQKVVDEVSVVVDSVHTGGTYANNRALLQAFSKSAENSPVRKRFVWTSGIMVYPNSPSIELLEEDPTDEKMTARSKFEQEVIKNTTVDGVVIRPGFVYGGAEGNFGLATYFKARGENDSIVITGNPDVMYSWIHITDLANAYVRAVEAGRGLITGEIFNVADDTRVTARQVRTVAGRAAGIRGEVVVVEDKSPAAHVFGKTVVVKANKIRHTLGWQPTNGPLLDNIPLYYRSWRAHGGGSGGGGH